MLALNRLVSLLLAVASVAGPLRTASASGCSDLGAINGCGSGLTNCHGSVNVRCINLTCTVTFEVTCTDWTGGEIICIKQKSVLSGGTEQVGGCCGCHVTPSGTLTWGTTGNNCSDFTVTCT